MKEYSSPEEAAAGFQLTTQETDTSILPEALQKTDDEIIREKYDQYLAGIKGATTLGELENAVQGLGMFFDTATRQYPHNQEYQDLWQHLRREYDVKKHGLELDTKS